jgi:hypothetical protein
MYNYAAPGPKNFSIFLKKLLTSWFLYDIISSESEGKRKCGCRILLRH